MPEYYDNRIIHIFIHMFTARKSSRKMMNINLKVLRKLKYILKAKTNEFQFSIC